MNLRRFIVACALVVAVGAPLIELCDRWDPSARDGGGDTESTAVIVALCVGAAFVLTTAVVLRVPPPMASFIPDVLRPGLPCAAPVMAVRFTAPRGRPPTFLRI